MSFIVVLLLIAAVLVWRHMMWTAQPWPKAALTPPKYQGHRGYWKGGAMENTMDSFKSAAARGLQMIEMDVRLSRDGVVVVYHDNDLKRLQNIDKTVFEMSADELKKLGIPTLEEVLLNREIPQLLNIELKTDQALDATLELAVTALVRKHKAENRVLFSSFNPLAVRRLGKLLPEVPRALLATRENDPSNRFYLKHLLFAPYIGANLLHLDHNYVTVEELERWKRRKVPVALWTVNDEARAKELLDHGAISIITDILK